jgi:hypothetical protein
VKDDISKRAKKQAQKQARQDEVDLIWFVKQQLSAAEHENDWVLSAGSTRPVLALAERAHHQGGGRPPTTSRTKMRVEFAIWSARQKRAALIERACLAKTQLKRP